MKSVGMTDPKQVATFIALGGIATALWFEGRDYPCGQRKKTPFRRIVYKIKPVGCYCLCL